MVSATPTPIDATGLSTGAVVGIIIGIVIGVSLLTALYYLFSYCCTIYWFVKLDKPDFLYTYDEKNRDCGTLMCINIGSEFLSCCCPSMREKIKNAKLYPKNATNLTVTNTSSQFNAPNSIFAYKKNPSYQGPRLQSDEEAQLHLVPKHLASV